MDKYIVAGNWKMNLNLREGEALACELASYLEDHPPEKSRVLVGVPYIHLAAVTKVLASSGAVVSAQDCSEHQKGAYTGEVSATQIKSTGAGAVIVGHSERRAYHHESEEVINQKIRRALDEDLTPILCVGELLSDRKNQRQESVVSEQLKGGLAGFDAAALQKMVIAYEPVWAIGTGETASPEQAQEMHAFIRKYLGEYYDAETAREVSILYGGSVKPDNAREIFGQPDVNGGLIGGASLKAASFLELIRIAEFL